MTAFSILAKNVTAMHFGELDFKNQAVSNILLLAWETLSKQECLVNCKNQIYLDKDVWSDSCIDHYAMYREIWQWG